VSFDPIGEQGFRAVKKNGRAPGWDALPDWLLSLFIVPVVWESLDSGQAAGGAPQPV